MQQEPICISVDIETTGKTPGRSSIYQLGACLVALPECGFTRDITPLSNDSYSPETLRAMGTSMEEILARKTSTPPREAMCALLDWVTKVAERRRAVFVGNNAPFDWMFVAWYFEEFGISNPFGHSALDMKSYFMGMTGCAWSAATLRNMAQLGGVPFEGLPHDALLDAKIQAQIFAKLLTLNTKGLS